MKKKKVRDWGTRFEMKGVKDNCVSGKQPQQQKTREDPIRSRTYCVVSEKVEKKWRKVIVDERKKRKEEIETRGDKTKNLRVSTGVNFLFLPEEVSLRFNVLSPWNSLSSAFIRKQQKTNGIRTTTYTRGKKKRILKQRLETKREREKRQEWSTNNN